MRPDELALAAGGRALEHPEHAGAAHGPRSGVDHEAAPGDGPALGAADEGHGVGVGDIEGVGVEVRRHGRAQDEARGLDHRAGELGEAHASALRQAAAMAKGLSAMAARV